MPHSCAMAGRCRPAVGGAARGGDDGGGILEGLARGDVARADAVGHQPHHRLAARQRILVAALVGCGRTRRRRQRQADRLRHHRHRVGGELAAAGAGARTGGALELMQIRVRHLAGGVLANGLEDVDHRHVLALELAGQDRAAVHEHRRHVEAQHGHHHAGQRFVAAGKPHHGVVAVAAHGQLDRSRRSPRATPATTSCPGGPWRCRRSP